MTFRLKLLITFLLVAAVPIVLLGVRMPRMVAGRIEGESIRRAMSLKKEVEERFARDAMLIRAPLAGLIGTLRASNDFRAAMAPGGDRRELIDWAAGVMRLSGLDVLVLQDSLGRIVSSGHNRSEADRRVNGFFVTSLGRADSNGALVRLPTADGEIQALAVMDTFTVGSQEFTLTGGRAIDSARIANLSPSEDLKVSLVFGDSLAPDDFLAEVKLHHIDDIDGKTGIARILIQRDPGPAKKFRREVGALMAATLVVTIAAAGLLATWMARMVGKPIAELADKTTRVDLERLDHDFSTDRKDEIGDLARLLDAMTVRLRNDTARLREAERRATVGDLARQINHDIKNGLAPIRHVLRHLSQVAESKPGELATVFSERRGSLESSVEYLDTLARNYAKLSPAVDQASTNVNEVLGQIVRSSSQRGAVVETAFGEPTLAVRADTLVLRRIFENIVGNAVDALEGSAGRVEVKTERIPGESGREMARITVTDTGKGMQEHELARAFDDFYTTKPQGTGLGLSVVRRLVSDLGGAVRVTTRPGEGTAFMVELPTG